MQFQSDISNCIVHRPEMIETTALGAAYLAGLAIGFWKSKEEIKNNWLLNKEFKPVIDDTQRDQLLTNWHKAIRLALLWKDINKIIASKLIGMSSLNQRGIDY